MSNAARQVTDKKENTSHVRSELSLQGGVAIDEYKEVTLALVQETFKRTFIELFDLVYRDLTLFVRVDDDKCAELGERVGRSVSAVMRRLETLSIFTTKTLLAFSGAVGIDESNLRSSLLRRAEILEECRLHFEKLGIDIATGQVRDWRLVKHDAAAAKSLLVKAVQVMGTMHDAPTIAQRALKFLNEVRIGKKPQSTDRIEQITDELTEE